MPRILIAGCGYVGAATGDLFHQAGWTVEGWTSSAAAAAALLGKPYPVIAVDITNRDQVNSRAENFDFIIHCASTRGGDAQRYREVYLNGVRNLLDRFVGSTLLFTSSTSVYAQTGGEWVTEESPVEPIHDGGRVLKETERLVLGRGGIVARLAAIHGPGRSALLKKFLSEEAVIDPTFDRFTNQVHRDDVAPALLRITDPGIPPASIYNVVDDTPIRQSECYRWLARKLGRPIPPPGKGADPKRGRSNKRVSNRKLRQMGWTPQYPSFPDAMEKNILPSFGL